MKFDTSQGLPDFYSLRRFIDVANKIDAQLKKKYLKILENNRDFPAKDEVYNLDILEDYPNVSIKTLEEILLEVMTLGLPNQDHLKTLLPLPKK